MYLIILFLMYFYLFLILLTYNSSTGKYILIFTYVLATYLRFTPPPLVVLLFPSTPFLEQFQQVSFFCFLIWIQNTSTIYNLIHPFLMLIPSQWYSFLEKTYFNLLSSFLIMCILIVHGSFTLILQGCIYHALMKLIPPLLTLSLSP
jgi:hypothetical protein